MKASNIIIVVLLIILFILISPLNAQNINVHEMIGQKIDVVISKYGKPVHQDRSNPAMECVFYKTNTYQMVFVSGKQGVYQAEGSKIFDQKTTALSELNKLVQNCQGKGFEADTLNVSEFDLHKKGVKMNVSLFENPYSKKYEVKVKANKSES